MQLNSSSMLKLVMTMYVVSLLGCSTVNNKVGEALNLDTDLTLNMLVSGEINPDERNQSSPVFVRLYELTSLKAFDNANFIDIYERDSEVLGDTMVAKQELKRVIPNTNRVERFVLSKDTRYVALFAEFYRYKDSKYKVAFPVTTSNVVRNSIQVNLSDNNITLVN